MGEALHKLHSEKLGGVIPSIAMGTHTREFPRVTQAALKQAGVEPRDLKAIAITNRPGLKGSLSYVHFSVSVAFTYFMNLLILSSSVGLKYAQYLSLKHNVPLIPIHHMEAHALMVRMFHKVNKHLKYLLTTSVGLRVCVCACAQHNMSLGL